jgi:hypothetical protein
MAITASRGRASAIGVDAVDQIRRLGANIVEGKMATYERVLGRYAGDGVVTCGWVRGTVL